MYHVTTIPTITRVYLNNHLLYTMYLCIVHDNTIDDTLYVSYDNTDTIQVI